MYYLDRVWQGWKRVGQTIGDFIGRIILTIFYFTLFMPFGIGVRLLSDPLEINQGHKVGWDERTTRDLTLDDTRRLF